MGILLSAMAAAGDAGVQSMNQNIDQMNKETLQDRLSALEENKAKHLLDYQAEAAVKVKSATAAQIDKAAVPFAEAQLLAKLNAANTPADGDTSGYTPYTSLDQIRNNSDPAAQAALQDPANQLNAREILLSKLNGALATNNLAEAKEYNSVLNDSIKNVPFGSDSRDNLVLGTDSKPTEAYSNHSDEKSETAMTRALAAQDAAAASLSKAEAAASKDPAAKDAIAAAKVSQVALGQLMATKIKMQEIGGSKVDVSGINAQILTATAQFAAATDLVNAKTGITPGISQEKPIIGDPTAPAKPPGPVTPADKFITGKSYTSNGVTKVYAGNGQWR